MYYLPVRYFVSDSFKQVDLVPHLRSDASDAPPGSIKASRGYAQKMTDNPVLCGRRDLSFVAQSDGVPYFKDRTLRSGTVASLRHGNLPEAMSKQNRNTHMVALQPSVYLSWCPDKNGPIKEHRNPKNQAPLVTVLSDELYELYTRGVHVIDHSMETGTPGREFLCRCVLLFWYTRTLLRSHSPRMSPRMSIRMSLRMSDRYPSCSRCARPLPPAGLAITPAKGRSRVWRIKARRRATGVKGAGGATRPIGGMSLGDTIAGSIEGTPCEKVTARRPRNTARQTA